MKKQLVIIGGGPAGLAAAISAWEQGIQDILILERDHSLGGILNQCIHNGFGLHTFQEELTGPEYADRYIRKVEALGIPYMLSTMVVNLTNERVIYAMNKEQGIFTIEAEAVILAMGCRERPRGALNIPGERPSGIYSAGTAQYFVNIEGRMPGREVVILGSGDIGLIMARRMTLEGATVKAVIELMPYSGGLKRNIVQCLDDYGIPLLLSHTITEIHGEGRVDGVTISQAGPDLKPVPGTEEYIKCDTILLSVGLLPENELSEGAGVELSVITGGPKVSSNLETSVEGVFACGNVLHVHDLVDFVSREAAQAGVHAADYIKAHGAKSEKRIPVLPEAGVRYTVPQFLEADAKETAQTFYFRVGNVYKNSSIIVKAGDHIIARKKKSIMSPGEMEEITIKGDDLAACLASEHVTLTLESEA